MPKISKQNSENNHEYHKSNDNSIELKKLTRHIQKIETQNKLLLKFTRRILKRLKIDEPKELDNKKTTPVKHLTSGFDISESIIQKSLSLMSIGGDLYLFTEVYLKGEQIPFRIINSKKTLYWDGKEWKNSTNFCDLDEIILNNISASYRKIHSNNNEEDDTNFIEKQEHIQKLNINSSENSRYRSRLIKKIRDKINTITSNRIEIN